MSFVKYINECLEDQERKNSIINELDKIKATISKDKGLSCYEPDLKEGKATQFAIALLKPYFESIDKVFNDYLEVGVLYGGTLCSLYNSGFKGMAYGLDIFKGYYGDKRHTTSEHMQKVMDNTEEYGGIPFLYECNTQKVSTEQIAKDINNPKLDVLYVDGDHSYKGAISDYNKLFPFLRSGGMLIMDNYEMKDVQKAVKDINKEDTCHSTAVWKNTMWCGIKR